jgi:mRNA-degrading endonuclease RelE of RelBE toxin-antitoxin system
MPSYDIQIHRSAKRRLQQLPDDKRERLVDTIASVAEEREPTSHESVRPLEGHRDLFRVRAGDCRAVCTLSKPDLLVVAAGARKNVYDDIDAVAERVQAVG